MSRSYPIWNKVIACKYNSDKSYGINDTGEVEIFVGSSASNSHLLVNHVTTRRFENHPKYGSVCIFKYSVDGVILKEMIFKNNNGKAGDHVKTRTKMNNLKSLK